jgi:hypothetical protein
MILIGVLSLVLVVILYIQFGGGGGDKPDGAASKYRPPRAAIAVQPATETAKPVTLAVAKTTPSTPANKAKEAAGASTIVESRWKSPELASVVAYDPFALPPAFPQPPKVILGAKGNGAEALIAAATADDAKKQAEAVEKLRTQLYELTQRGVHVIVRERDGYAAMIDDRLIRVGDRIDDFTVTAIDPDGVHVERKESP